jgi:uncharacterized membrane protein YfcA
VLGAAAAAIVAGFIKGAIGFGFPTIGTPLLALFVDVKIAVPLLVPPNLLLDGIQARRGGHFAATTRRLTVLLLFGAVGMVIGTRLLIGLPSRVVTLVLGAFVLAFVVLNATRFRLRVPDHWEHWLSPPVGLLAGIVGGITNVPGTPLIIYFYALGMDKRTFVRSVALSFIVYKVTQLGALAWYGAFSAALVPASLGLVLAGFLGFAIGLRVQDRLDQQAFNRAVLVFLAALGVWLTIRSL